MARLLKNKDLLTRVTITAVAVVLAVLHATDQFTLDQYSMALLLAALLPWIIHLFKSVELPGGLKLELQDLTARVEKAERELTSLQRQQNQLRREYVQLCETYSEEMTLKEMDGLGTKLKGLASGLADLEFLRPYLKEDQPHGRVFGAACALQVRPQTNFLSELSSLIDAVAKDSNLCGMRLRLVYRLVMSAEAIGRLEGRMDDPYVSSGHLKPMITAIERLRRNPRCQLDDEKHGTKGIGNRIDRTVKVLSSITVAG